MRIVCGDGTLPAATTNHLVVLGTTISSNGLVSAGGSNLFTGNVGIGTNSPQAALHTFGSSIFDSSQADSGTYFYTGTNNPGVTIVGTGGGVSSGKPILLIVNTNLGDGESYSNECHVALQAAGTNNGRTYFKFRNHQGSDRWYMGKNASDVLIAFDNVQARHRLWFACTNYPSEGWNGISSIISGGTNDVRINWYPGTYATNSMKVGNGFSVWTPGAASSAFTVISNANVGIGTNSPQAKLDIWLGTNTATVDEAPYIMRVGSARLNSSNVLRVMTNGEVLLGSPSGGYGIGSLQASGYIIGNAGVLAGNGYLIGQASGPRFKNTTAWNELLLDSTGTNLATLVVSNLYATNAISANTVTASNTITTNLAIYGYSSGFQSTTFEVAGETNFVVDLSKPYQRFDPTNLFIQFPCATNYPAIANEVKTCRVKVYTTNTVTVNFPAGWVKLSTNLVWPANKVTVLTVEADGANETNVVAKWESQQ